MCLTRVCKQNKPPFSKHVSNNLKDRDIFPKVCRSTRSLPHSGCSFNMAVRSSQPTERSYYTIRLWRASYIGFYCCFCKNPLRVLNFRRHVAECKQTKNRTIKCPSVWTKTFLVNTVIVF